MKGAKNQSGLAKRKYHENAKSWVGYSPIVTLGGQAIAPLQPEWSSPQSHSLDLKIIPNCISEQREHSCFALQLGPSPPFQMLKYGGPNSMQPKRERYAISLRVKYMHIHVLLEENAKQKQKKKEKTENTTTINGHRKTKSNAY